MRRAFTSAATVIAPAAVGLVAACALSGCADSASSPVSIPPASPTATAARACDQLSASLPSQVLGQSARATSPDSSTTAAWGSPEIVLVCGVERPAARTLGAQLFVVNGITWFAEELTTGTRFTSEDRTANIRVDVPDTYRPEAEALIDLAPAIKEAVPATTATPRP